MELLRVLIWMIMGGVAAIWIVVRLFDLKPKYKQEKNNEESSDEEDIIDEDFEQVDDNFDNEIGDNEKYYYVLLPDQKRPVEICIEQRLEYNHFVMIKDKLYVVRQIIHKVNGHSLYVLEYRNNVE